MERLGRHYGDSGEGLGRDCRETVKRLWRDWGEIRVEYGETGRETAI